MRILFLSLLALFCYSNVLFSQAINQDSILGWEYIHKGTSFQSTNLDSTFYYIEKAQQAFKKAKVWTSYVQTFASMSTIYYAKEEFDQFKQYAFLSLDKANQYLDKNDKAFGIVWNNLSFYYYQTGDHEQRIECLKKALKIYTQLGSKKLKLANTYHNIGLAYRTAGDYDQAINYHFKALDFKIKSEGASSFPVAQSYLHLGHNYRDKKEIEKALKYYHLFLSIANRKDIVKNKLVYRNVLYGSRGIAEVHLLSGQIDSAAYYLEEAIKVFPHVKEHRQILPYNSLGNLYLKQQNYTQAIEAFEKAKDLSFQIYGGFNKHTVKSRSIKSIGNVYFAQEKYDKALDFYQQALVMLSLDYENESVDSNPPIAQMISKVEGLDISQAKAKCFYEKWQANGAIKDLELALQNAIQAINITAALRRNLLETGSKLFLAEKSLEIYEQGIQCALQLYKATKAEKYLAKAFKIAEQNKATLLLESLKGKAALFEAHIPLTAS